MIEFVAGGKAKLKKMSNLDEHWWGIPVTMVSMLGNKVKITLSRAVMTPYGTYEKGREAVCDLESLEEYIPVPFSTNDLGDFPKLQVPRIGYHPLA
jgi:hypothetical protein